MAAAWMRARHDLRRRGRGAAALALLLGIAGGVALASASSARRTSSAFERLLRSSTAYDVEVQVVGDADASVLDSVAALPQVVDHARMSFIPSMIATPGKHTFSWDVTSIAFIDANVGRTLEVPRISAGRFPRPDATHEAFANEAFARRHKVKPGDSLTLQLATFDELFEVFGGGHPTANGPEVTIEIAGVGSIPHDTTINEPAGFISLTPAFFKTYSEQASHLEGMLVRLKRGDADVSQFLVEAKKIARAAAKEVSQEEVLSFRSNVESRAAVERALRVESLALWIFAAVVSAGAILVLGQALGRWQTLAADDHAVLRSLGMGRAELVAASTFPILFMAVGSVVIAIGVALAISPALPVGFARSVEPHLAVFADTAILAIGGFALFAVIAAGAVARAVLLARRARMNREAETVRPSTVAGLASRGGFAAPAVTGIRFAVEPGTGRSAVPVRSVLAGTGTAILAIVAAFVFGTSLHAMLTTPRTYGWNFDLIAAGGDAEENLADLQQQLAASRLVAEFSEVSVKTTTFKDRDLETLGIQPIKGSVHTVVLEGRFPRAADEVALAARTLREAGVNIGDRVTLPAPDDTCAVAPCAVSFRVVGKTVHWAEGTDTDAGAAFTKEGQARVRTSGGFTDFLVRVPPGPGRLASIRALERELGDTISPYSSSELRGSAKLPQNLRNVDRVRSLPTIVAAVLAVLALVTLIHALLMTARRRRHDLAVLKTLGFVRRQVASTVAWQATTLVLLALIVGVPLGIASGRWTWTLLASRLGVVVHARVEPVWIALGVLGSIGLATLISVLPGRTAAKTPPALVLRTE